MRGEQLRCREGERATLAGGRRVFRNRVAWRRGDHACGASIRQYIVHDARHGAGLGSKHLNVPNYRRWERADCGVTAWAGGGWQGRAGQPVGTDVPRDNSSPFVYHICTPKLQLALGTALASISCSPNWQRLETADARSSSYGEPGPPLATGPESSPPAKTHLSWVIRYTPFRKKQPEHLYHLTR